MSGCHSARIERSDEKSQTLALGGILKVQSKQSLKVDAERIYMLGNRPPHGEPGDTIPIFLIINLQSTTPKCTKYKLLEHSLFAPFNSSTTDSLKHQGKGGGSDNSTDGSSHVVGCALE